MQTILLPVDGSENSSRAVHRAIELVKQFGDAKLLLITAYPPIVSGNVKRFFSADEIQSFYQDEGRAALAPAKAILDAAGVEYEEILVGPVAQSIADYAKKKQVDTIIMGTRGLGAVTGMVLGSVTTKVLSMVDMPVLLVK